MDPSSSPGDDGIQAGVYKAFPEFFVRNMYRAYQEIEVEGLPDEWVTALVWSLPKDPGSAAVDRQRPIALQQARLKWLIGVLLLQLQDALFQLVPSQQKAHLRGRTMFDHLASVQQTRHTGPGDEVAAWLVVDYSKAYDSVSHPMMAALFRFICIPTPWVCVLLQILRRPVLFLVMGGVVREHSLTPASGIRQGDPLSPILFSLLTSVICFILRPYGVDVWLYSDDAQVRLCRPGVGLEADLQSLLAEFAAFGEYTGLCLNLEKTRLLLQGLDSDRLAGIKVVPHVRYLGAQVGHVSPAVAYERCVALFESRCTRISRMPLSRVQKVVLLHTWCYLVLQVTAIAHYPPHLVVKRLRRALVIAFHAQNWKVPLNVLHLSPSEGGIGLWSPEVYLWTTHAATFTRYLQQPSRYGPGAYTVFSSWLERKGIVHTPSQLALLQLSPCCIRNAPWLASSVKALSSLNAAQKGLGLEWQELAAAPLWNSRLLTVSEKSVTCKFLIRKGILRLSDVVDTSAWVAIVSRDWQGSRKLQPHQYQALLALVRRLIPAWEGHHSVQGLPPPSPWTRGYSSLRFRRHWRPSAVPTGDSPKRCGRRSAAWPFLRRTWISFIPACGRNCRWGPAFERSGPLFQTGALLIPLWRTFIIARKRVPGSPYLFGPYSAPSRLSGVRGGGYRLAVCVQIIPSCPSPGRQGFCCGRQCGFCGPAAVKWYFRKPA